MKYLWMFEVLEDMRTFARQHGLKRVEEGLKEVIDTALDEIPIMAINELKKLTAYERQDAINPSLEQRLISHGLDQKFAVHSSEYGIKANDPDKI